MEFGELLIVGVCMSHSSRLVYPELEELRKGEQFTPELFWWTSGERCAGHDITGEVSVEIIRFAQNDTKIERSHWLADESIVRGVVADPEPQDSVLDVNAQAAMVKADAACPKPAHTF